MRNNYLTYQKFSDAGLAEIIAGKLKEREIEFFIEDTSRHFDVSFANNTFGSNINLKLKAEDFERADEALEDIYKRNLDEVEKDYYLFSFSEDELRDVIGKADEWGHFDFLLAQKILKERGKAVDTQEIKLLRFRRLNELAEPESMSYAWIVLAYIFSAVAGLYTILGGFAGIFMGWALMYLKKTLPDGHVVYSYDTEFRKQGKFLLLFSIVITCVGYILRLKHFY